MKTATTAKTVQDSVGMLGVLAAAVSLAAMACSGGGSSATDGGSGGNGGMAGGNDAADDATGGSGGSDGPPDLPADFSSDGRPACPMAGSALPAVEAALLIDDFTGNGRLDGRRVSRAGFSVHEQFDATVNAQFDEPPSIDPRCGAAAPGAAYIAGMPADQGATFAIIFGGPDGGTADFFDASAMKGITFRAAVGDPRSSRLFSLRAGVAGSNWSYTVDFNVDGTGWKQIDVPWTELDKSKAPAAPAFDSSKLSQLVLLLTSGADVDVFLDDFAFIR